MPATATTSCTTPASGFSCAASVLAVAGWPLVILSPLPLPLVSSQVAVVLLKNSDDASRLIGGCLVRAMVFEGYHASREQREEVGNNRQVSQNKKWSK